MKIEEHLNREQLSCCMFMTAANCFVHWSTSEKNLTSFQLIHIVYFLIEINY